MSKFLFQVWDGVIAEAVQNEDGSVEVTPTASGIDGTVTYDSMAAALLDYTDAIVLEEN